MIWQLKYGEELGNIEAMKASFQKIPEHLLNPIEPEEHLMLLWRMFWELDSERNYFSTGLSQKIPVSMIEKKIESYDFLDYEAEELKVILMQIDRAYREYDATRIQQERDKQRA